MLVYRRLKDDDEKYINLIGRVMDRQRSSFECTRCGFEDRSGQTEDYKIGIDGFLVKHPALRRNSKY